MKMEERDERVALGNPPVWKLYSSLFSFLSLVKVKVDMTHIHGNKLKKKNESL